MHELTLDLTHAVASDALDRVGTHHPSPITGSVTVAIVSADRDTATYRLTGEPQALLAWLTREWHDSEVALNEYTEAALDGRLRPVAG